MSYKIPKCLAFISSLMCALIVGGFLIDQSNEITFNSLNKNKRLYLILVIFSEISLAMCVIYFTLSLVWSGIISCYNDDYNTTFQFSVSKILFLLSNFGANIYLLYHLIYHTNYINDNMDLCSWLLVGNMFFIILSTILYKCYHLYRKKNYEDI